MNLKELYNIIRRKFVRANSSMPFDEIGIKPYFMPIFYFSSADTENGGSAHGLLCNDFSFTASDKFDMNVSQTIGDSAYNFLITNGDMYRADQLKLFNNILFTMSNTAPWHFTKLDVQNGSAISKAYLDGKFSQSDANKQLTLTLSADTLDNMHHTLFSIYKNLLWDSERDVMILPQNLRRFNMGVILFTPPITFIDGLTADDLKEKFIWRRFEDGLYKHPEMCIDFYDTQAQPTKWKTTLWAPAHAANNMIVGNADILYTWDWKNLPYYEATIKDREINVRFDDLSDTSDQSSWWKFLEFRGCEFDEKTMLEANDINADNTVGGNKEEGDKLVINYKKMYVTTCEKFFDLNVTDIPSQYNIDSYKTKTQFNNVASNGSAVWNKIKTN